MIYVNSCLLQQLTNKYNLTEGNPLYTQLHSTSYYNPPTYANTFSVAPQFRMVSAHIRALDLRAKLHKHSKERRKAGRQFNQIYCHLLNAVVVFIVEISYVWKCSYWNMEEEAIDRTWWRTRFGSGCGPVVRQTTQWIPETVSISAAKKLLFIFAIVTV